MSCRAIPNRFTTGFTLLELMVALAVLAILVSLSMPSFSALIAQTRIASATNDLLSDMEFARHEAIRRNDSVVLCGSRDRSGCASDGWQQWIVTTGKGLVLRTGQMPDRSDVTVSDALRRGLVFQSTGLVSMGGRMPAEGSILVCSTAVLKRYRVVIGSGISLQRQKEDQGCG
ncbi:GspH/FimT family pseudopilin [Stenotrophomonas sp. CFBP 13718]|uniref:GspH/FimT family pseudopilin n=1 Tax=Stenotrophomonas sp. CFBP 13718 TaxID=2775304 RepID=UPI0017856931|nr:GspH/FimT family pseudopilin [Stenotrophomonas sp. CFBP 13718]MBD8698051.1 GspH/FimT family pseudopilin [Stenotrophomonas sp. CFBP 13718]